MKKITRPIFNKWRELYDFLKRSYNFLSYEKPLLIVFIILSFLGVLTEGIGVSMLIPLLESQSGKNLFQDVAVLKWLPEFFSDMDKGDKLFSISIVLMFILILRGILLYFVNLLASIVPLRLQRRIIKQGYDALLNVEYSYIQEKPVGEHLNVLNEWGRRVTSALTCEASIFFNSVVLLVYLALMFALSVEMTLWAILVLGSLLILMRAITTGPLVKLGNYLSEKDSLLNKVTFETIAGLKFIRSMSLETMMSSKFGQRILDKTNADVKMKFIQTGIPPFFATSVGVLICVLLMMVSTADDGDIEAQLSSLMVFLVLLMRLSGPAMQINVNRAIISGNLHAFYSFDKFMNEAKQRKQISGQMAFANLKHSITFENVGFKYSDTERAVINGLTASIEVGQMVAVVGPSGSGKSTLVSLLLNLYQPQNGKILMDGIDVNDIAIKDLRKAISVVSQDIFIFDDTVRNNLLISAEGVSEDDIQYASKLARLDDFVSKFPSGYDTALGDRGAHLSGGQQQRLAIARAILRDSSVLILDEATSSLDTITERAIQDAVEELRKDRTMIVIAHRLSTIQRADKVIVLKDGQVVEEGGHNELLEKKGEYWNMVSHQQLDLVK